MEADFATLLHRYRRAAGLTQHKLAEKAGVSLAAIGALERGVRRFPRPETVTALAYAMGLTAEERAVFAAAARRQKRVQPDAAASAPAASSASRGQPPAETAAPLVPRQLPLP